MRLLSDVTVVLNIDVSQETVSEPFVGKILDLNREMAGEFARCSVRELLVCFSSFFFLSNCRLAKFHSKITASFLVDEA